ncbi:hypothetical protein [Streptomyces purpurogeneiscleroticus]|nr:hypothetical protein [Streptomyces purpurogeneiscleroticus]
MFEGEAPVGPDDQSAVQDDAVRQRGGRGDQLRKGAGEVSAVTAWW